MERVADYIIRKVREAGAKHIFLVSGRGILFLTDAVAKNKKINPISTFHEQGASYAAMAYASANNGISACLVSSGCAATNAVTACLCAYQDNLPVVFISGNNPLIENKRHTGVNIRTYGSQETDIIPIVQSITKYAVMLEYADSVVYEVEKALYLAQEGRKGPVWIDVPLDVQNMRIEEEALNHYVIDESLGLDCVCVKQVADELNASKRPIILIGGGARDSRKQLKKLIEDYNIPAVCSPAAADVYGSSNELSIGTVGSLGGSRAGNFAIQNSDFVLSIGSKLCTQLTGVKDNFAREAKVIAIDIDKNEHTKKGVVDQVINCDAKVFLERLLSCGIEVCDKTWSDKCVHWKEIFSVKNEQFVTDLKTNNLIDLYSLLDELSSILPTNATVITDAGFEELTVPSVIRYQENQRCLFPAAQGAMGYAIPAIIGAYEAGRENICCIVGDGSIMMNIQELQIVSALNIPVIIIVINNNMYAVIRKRQTDLFRKRTLGNDPSDGVPQPDYRMIAQSFGFDYIKIVDRNGLLKEMPDILNRKHENRKPIIIEIMCVENQNYLHESYAFNENRRLVHRPIEDLSPFLPRELYKNEMIIAIKEE